MSHTINELVILRNMGFFIKQLAERECGYKYSEIPINRGKYEGDNEAN